MFSSGSDAGVRREEMGLKSSIFSATGAGAYKGSDGFVGFTYVVGVAGLGLGAVIVCLVVVDVTLGRPVGIVVRGGVQVTFFSAAVSRSVVVVGRDAGRVCVVSRMGVAGVLLDVASFFTFLLLSVLGTEDFVLSRVASRSLRSRLILCAVVAALAISTGAVTILVAVATSI